MRTQSDFDYEKKRNGLIQHAEATANEKCGATAEFYEGDKTLWALAWNRVYLTTMDALAVEMELFK